METPPSTSGSKRYPRKVIIGLIVGWILIVIKCALAPTLMHRWQVPVDPGWVIVPTFILAALVTLLVLTRDWAHEDD